MTYAEALALGYTRGRTSMERGYVSRRSNPANHVVQAARGGELHVSLANWQSTRYCYRQYLVAPKV